MLLRKLLSGTRSPPPPAGGEPEYPLELEARYSDLHARVAVKRHLGILYGGLRIGGEPFPDLYFRCLEETGTVLTPFNVFQRFQTRHDLVRYLLATLDVPGARVECGAYRGATALLLCRAWRSERADFTGESFYLVDSFSGTQASGERDYIPVREAGGEAKMAPFFPAGKTDVRIEDVRGAFREFPAAQIVAGWIPEVFHALPDTAWAFVHLDVTLYEATLAALRYFYPKLSPGGVLICEGSVFCPGVEKAVGDFSAAAGNVPYATLGHREIVFMKA